MVDEVFDLIRQCIEESVYKGYELRDEQIMDELYRCLVDQTTRACLVAMELTGRVVGVITATIVAHPYVNATVALETSMMVSHTTKNRKLAWSKLLDGYENWCRDNGVNLISIASYRSTLTSVYENLGYIKNADSLFKKVS